MVIIYHDPNGDVVYESLQRIEFSPEADLTLNSLPVDALTVDIVTADTLERGVYVSLATDASGVVLFAHFPITKVQRMSKDVLRVEAMSPLWLMDWWTVGAERIQTTAAAAVQDLFTGLPKSGYLSLISYSLPAELGAMQIDGFAPEQKARERLLWLCVCMGAWVQQSFTDTLTFHELPDLMHWNMNAGDLIPLSQIYWKPDIKIGDPVHNVSVQFVHDMSTTEAYQNMQRGTAEDGTEYYWLTGYVSYTNPDADAPGGSEIKIDGISLLGSSDSTAIIDKLPYIYQNRMEITAEIIDNGGALQGGGVYARPGDEVRIYTDEDEIYYGIVRQTSFTFGQQSKARLTINANPTALPTQLVRVLFTADGIPIGEREFVYPEGDVWEVESPEIDGYTPDQASISGSTGGDYSVDYTELPLNHIRVVMTGETDYLEGSEIDFTGLKVYGYTSARGAAKDVLWTNGGQWLDGRIPNSALTFPVKTAIYDETHETTPGQISVQEVVVQYTDRKTGTVFEDSFTINVYEYRPDYIEVVTPPRKLVYNDGEYIDFTGMVVKAYESSGVVWTNYGKWPDGVIPDTEVARLVTKADIDKAVTGKGTRSLDGKSVEVAKSMVITQYLDGELNRIVTDTCPDGVVIIMNEFHMLTAVSDSEDAAVHYAYSQEGRYFACEELRGTQGFTELGKIGDSPTTGNPLYGACIAGFDWYDGIGFARNDDPVIAGHSFSTLMAADIALYGSGDLTGQQEIPIGWYYSDGTLLTASFNIDVTEVQHA